MIQCDYLIVGAGFVGSVLAERLASQKNKKIIVLDRREHIAGNAHDRRNEYGILYHQYGPHIFHTNSDKVFEYLSQFTEWLPYEHRVVGVIDGRLIPIPFNLTSLEILFTAEKAARLKDKLVQQYGMDNKVSVLEMLKNTDAEISDLAEYIYKNVFLGYTIKQWGLTPEELAPSVTARVPIYISYDDRYFQDTHQQMPKYGYTKLIQNILNNNNIEIRLNQDYKNVKKIYQYEKLIYTGAIDEFFDYELGYLPYRSLRFDFQIYRQKRHQSTGQVNYPNSNDFTRITEMSYLTQEQGDKTMVAIEYPMPHVPGKTVPYYPIPRDENNLLHEKYLELAKQKAPNVIFAGRLGDYRYYNMDQAVASALAIFSKIQ
jgi:UDP-galactopyranose mutase